MRCQRFRLEFGMELAGEKPRMVGNLDDFHKILIGGNTGNHWPVIRQDVFELPIEFISMAMPLRDHIDFVNAGGEGLPFELRGVGSQAHSPADRVDAEQIAELINHRIRRVRIKLGAISLPQSANILGDFDDRALHSEANAEVLTLLLARDFDSKKLYMLSSLD